MNNPSIMSHKALNRTTSWFVAINDWIKSAGIIIGGLAASLADWITGSVALSVLFSGANLSFPAWIVGTIWSLGSWGVQLLLWEIILSGKANKLWSSTWNKVTIIAVVVLKFLDDIIDLMAVYYMVYNSPLKEIIPSGIAYNIFIVVTYLLSYILVGFSEVFVSVAIYTLRGTPVSDNTQTRRVPSSRPRRASAHTVSPSPSEREIEILSKLPHLRQ